MSKKVVCACLALICAIASPASLSATMGTVEVAPAATLLVPYFEVALDDPNGITTLLSVVNSSSAPAAV